MTTATLTDSTPAPAPAAPAANRLLTVTDDAHGYHFGVQLDREALRQEMAASIGPLVNRYTAELHQAESPDHAEDVQLAKLRRVRDDFRAKLGDLTRDSEALARQIAAKALEGDLADDLRNRRGQVERERVTVESALGNVTDAVGVAEQAASEARAARQAEVRRRAAHECGAAAERAQAELLAVIGPALRGLLIARAGASAVAERLRERPARKG